jgi:phytoene dehydrogenase-like protein
VVVIGAGLAGFRCTTLLAAHGRDVAVCEAAGADGGRVRTDEIDGFRCDRGFQVLNPAYPELKRAVDVSRLCLQSFEVGAGIRRERDAIRWVHPLRNPARLPAMLDVAPPQPCCATAERRHQPVDPGTPLNGPAIQLVIQPP